MPDFQSSPPPAGGTLPHLYPSGGTPATPALARLLHGKIAAEGPLPFPDFMELALYHPEHGYYARQTRQVGREGDFFTSVSVGPLFGRLLARRFLAWWRADGSPAPWRIIESGAHDGTLAADILQEIRTLDPHAFSSLEYVIPEPLPLLRSAQREKLSGFSNLRSIGHPGELSGSPLPGIAFGNEVLDALPFHVIGWKNGRWEEYLVGSGEGRFTWTASGTEFPDGPAGDFPEGYRTEIRTCLRSFFEPLTGALSRGLLLWPDYGYAATDYYHPDRTTGTLRTFSRHQAAENPLDAPGEADITAHVDFTSAADAAVSLGCQPLTFKNQGTWLTEIARELLVSMEGNADPAVLRQFQSLTHPGHLGSRFHVLELSWNDPHAPPIPEAELRRLR